MSPRPLSDGTKVGWGLMALILAAWAAMVALIGAVGSWLWRKTR